MIAPRRALSVAPRSVIVMGFTSAWSVSSHPDSVIAELTPHLAPALEADRTQPAGRRRWEAWRCAPLPDHRTWYRDRAHDGAIDSFLTLTRPGGHVDEVCNGITDRAFHVMEDVWEPEPEAADMFVSVHRKDYAVAALFHAIGPDRAALLPGWCGNVLLTAAEVRRTLPDVERALTFTPGNGPASATGTGWTTAPATNPSPTAPCASGGPRRRRAAASARSPCTSTDHAGPGPGPGPQDPAGPRTADPPPGPGPGPQSRRGPANPASAGPGPAAWGHERQRDHLHPLHPGRSRPGLAGPHRARPHPAVLGLSFETDWAVGSRMDWVERGARTSDPEQVVLDCVPDRRLSYTWHTFTPQWAASVGIAEELRAELAQERRTKVTYEIEPVGDTLARLTILHEDFEPGGTLIGMCGRAWPMLASSLKTLLETGAPLPEPGHGSNQGHGGHEAHGD